MPEVSTSNASRKGDSTPARVAHIGATVHAVQRTSPRDVPQTECQAAVITTVLGDPGSAHGPMVNLVVFGDSPEGTGVQFVHAASYDEPGEVYAKRGTWHWPH